MLKNTLSTKEKLRISRNALRLAINWKWATDGRKFNGNLKLILKEIITDCEDAYNKTNPSNKSTTHITKNQINL